MKDMKKKRRILVYIGITTVIVTLAFCFIVIRARHLNAEELQQKLESPESIYNGSFDTKRSGVEVINGINDEEIYISFYDENLNYDEEHLSLQHSGNHDIRGFNAYYIKYPNYPYKENQDKVIWHLCRYDEKEGVILLDGNNKKVGRIFYTLSSPNLWGEREIQYYLHNSKGTKPIYKSADYYYSHDGAYLQSKYYAGPIK